MLGWLFRRPKSAARQARRPSGEQAIYLPPKSMTTTNSHFSLTMTNKTYFISGDILYFLGYPSELWVITKKPFKSVKCFMDGEAGASGSKGVCIYYRLELIYEE